MYFLFLLSFSTEEWQRGNNDGAEKSQDNSSETDINKGSCKPQQYVLCVLSFYSSSLLLLLLVLLWMILLLWTEIKWNIRWAFKKMKQTMIYFHFYDIYLLSLNQRNSSRTQRKRTNLYLQTILRNKTTQQCSPSPQPAQESTATDFLPSQTPDPS